MSYAALPVEKYGVVLPVTLNRPQVLNAISSQLADELIDAVPAADKEADVHSIVPTGAGKAFAAGAAIKEKQQRGFSSNLFARLVGRLEGIYGYTQAYHRGTSRLRLGGGCALAVMGYDTGGR
jgi:enoyl-CoA hydratase